MSSAARLRATGLWGLLALCLMATAASAAVECPSTQNGRPLGLISVFDGPPAEMVDLRPEASGKIDMWTALDQSGRPAFLVCRYRGVTAEATLQLPPGTATCRGVRRP
ncbi:MAG: hypothetical protein B7Z15_03470, partial [Rhizobiales bacterium 32-66-8]